MCLFWLDWIHSLAKQLSTTISVRIHVNISSYVTLCCWLLFAMNRLGKSADLNVTIVLLLFSRR